MQLVPQMSFLINSWPLVYLYLIQTDKADQGHIMDGKKDQ